MTPTQTELDGLFAGLSDSELERRAASGGLTVPAQQTAEAELARRGLPPPPASAEPAPAAESDPGRFLLVSRFNNPMDAQTLRARLEAEGIPVLLAGANHSQAFVLLSPVLGGVRVEVPEQYAEQARALIDEFDAGKLALEEETDPEGIAAEAALVEKRRRRIEMAAAGVILIVAMLNLLWAGAVVVTTLPDGVEWSAAAIWTLALPATFLVAALLFAWRSQWSLALFALHLAGALVLHFIYAQDLYALGAGLKTAALSGLVLYYGIYLLGQGRLR